LTFVINVSWGELKLSELAQVHDRVVIPEHPVERANAIPRLANNLAPVIDRVGDSVWVARKCRKFMDGLTFFPEHRLKMEHLGSIYAGWIWCGILRHPDDLTSTVDLKGLPAAAKRRKRGHRAVLPKERETYKVGTETAKIFF